MTQAILQTRGLSKRFWRKIALKPLDFSLEPGAFLGLLGVNGSGKSTLVKITAGLTRPGTGQVEVLGHAPGPQTKRDVAYMPDVDNLYTFWNAHQAFAFYAQFFAMNRARFQNLLEFLHLDPNARFGTLSKGNRTRLRLALTLARDARLYLLDEPLSGIDPLTREQILGALGQEFRFEGASFVLATHQVAEAEFLFDRVLALDGGEVLLEGSANTLRTQYGLSIDQIVKNAALEKQRRPRK
jgi:ABC-2 type transport system ATP-binding protein